MDTSSLDMMIQSFHIDGEQSPGNSETGVTAVVAAAAVAVAAVAVAASPEEPVATPEELNKLRLRQIKLNMTKQDVLHLHVVAKYMFANKYTVIPYGFLDVLDDLIKKQSNQPKKSSRSNSLTSQEPILPEIVIPPAAKRRPSLTNL